MRDLPGGDVYWSPLQTDTESETTDCDGSLHGPTSAQSGEVRKRLLSEEDGSGASDGDASVSGARPGYGPNKRGRGNCVGAARARAGCSGPEQPLETAPRPTEAVAGPPIAAAPSRRESLPDLRVVLTRCDRELVASNERSRSRSPNFDDGPGTSTIVAPTRRGRGRTPTTGEYVRYAKAVEAANKAKREELRLRNEEEAEKFCRSLGTRQVRLSETSTDDEVNLNDRVRASLEAIDMVAQKSSHLKGTFQKALKDSAKEMKKVFEVLRTHTVSDETRQLEAENKRLKAELADVRSELRKIREDMQRFEMSHRSSLPTEEMNVAQFVPSGPHPPAPSKKKAKPNETAALDIESIVQAVTKQVGSMINARFDGLEKEGRLLPAQSLRPPLASDKRKESAANVVQKPAKSVVPVAGKKGPPNYTEEPQKISGKGKGKGKKSAVPQPNVNQSTATFRTQPASACPSTGEEWQKVGPKGKRKKKTTKAASKTQPKQKQQPKKARKLVPPRSSAVVLTLLPEAVEKGVTYAKVLTEAKSRVDLAGLGITALRIKRAITGGTVLEVPGTTSGDKADQLARALVEKLGPEAVRVSRPVKCAELRLTELDDSISPEVVVAAIASVGQCSAALVKTGEVRRGLRRLGTLWVRCPVTAAKKITQAGRLELGWGLSAKVSLLEERPMRCFRCLQTGHTGAQCIASEDYSNHCYNCGQPGHKRSACSGSPQCILCHAAGKPADHKIGSKACTNPKHKTKHAGDGPRAPSQAVIPSTGAVEEAEMEIVTTDN
ncbi:serine/arginine repetitive matrix protein 2-like [Cydia amplana]|uniref:serine/arginine repetitive matrix protein 2-like n=1 Tax=Cydia amplana TaxID=1869771 RepID=UPI002FE51C20